jgi:hypothetical protein
MYVLVCEDFQPFGIGVRRLHVFVQTNNIFSLALLTQLVGRTDDARRLLLDDVDGRMYVCGNRNLPKPLQDALVLSFSNNSKHPNEIAAAAKAVEDLYIRGRAQQEVW